MIDIDAVEIKVNSREPVQHRTASESEDTTCYRWNVAMNWIAKKEFTSTKEYNSGDLWMTCDGLVVKVVTTRNGEAFVKVISPAYKGTCYWVSAVGEPPREWRPLAKEGFHLIALLINKK
jgi:hypothetical protein